MSWERELATQCAQLQHSGLYRQLRTVEGCQAARMTVDGHSVLMLAGSNYLGLASDRRVVEAACAATLQFGGAAGGARLISGNLPVHTSLEEELARFVGSEACLLFSTGYMASLGVLTALAGPEDVVVSDELNHASLIDGCRLSRAEVVVFRHNDVDDFARVCRRLTGFRRRLLVVDGLYSMDGDLAPLNELVPIARKHDMLVVVDDAHGLGVLGTNGRGVTELAGVAVDIQIGNLGKALGSFGAYVACSHVVREYLINTCRPFIFTCGLLPAAAGAAREALRILQSEPQRRRDLISRADQLREGLRQAGYDTATSTTHIVPAIIGDNEVVMRLCQSAIEQGVYAQGIRYPSVPAGTARIRFTPTALHTHEDIDEAVRVWKGLKGGG